MISLPVGASPTPSFSAFQVEPVELSVAAFRENPFGSIALFWTSLLCGVLVWLLMAVPLTTLLYWALRPVVRIVMGPRFSGGAGMP